MIRKCTQSDIEDIFIIINAAAQAYKNVIPDDCWHEPYMSREHLKAEIQDAVEFWCLVGQDQLQGVMGVQDKGPVTLIRHAYVHTSHQRGGVGTRMLRHLETLTDSPILIGTWQAATWAIRFYESNGYSALSRQETNRLLRQYWSIPERQIATSVVLAKWNRNGQPQARQVLSETPPSANPEEPPE
jgi:GNAT superfamily N-acetyltransferase